MRQNKIYVVADTHRDFVDWLTVNELPKQPFIRFNTVQDVMGVDGAAYVVIQNNDKNKFYNSVLFGTTVARRRMIKLPLEKGHMLPAEMRASFLEHGFYLTDPSSK